MGTKVRPRPGGAWAEVIDLHSFRNRQRGQDNTNVLLVPGGGKWSALLSELPNTTVFEVSDLLRLRTLAVTRNPAVALIDGALSWGLTSQMVRELQQSFGIPSVAISDTPPKAGWTKRVFAAGLHDLLVAPQSPDEIQECLDLIRKIGLAAQG